jgi:hypothetical protein
VAVHSPAMTPPSTVITQPFTYEASSDTAFLGSPGDIFSLSPTTGRGA